MVVSMILTKSFCRSGAIHRSIAKSCVQTSADFSTQPTMRQISKSWCKLQIDREIVTYHFLKGETSQTPWVDLTARQMARRILIKWCSQAALVFRAWISHWAKTMILNLMNYLRGVLLMEEMLSVSLKKRKRRRSKIALRRVRLITTSNSTTWGPAKKQS